MTEDTQEIPKFTMPELMYEEYGTATGVRFCTSEGIKTMEPGKLYDKDLNEI